VRLRRKQWQSTSAATAARTRYTLRARTIAPQLTIDLDMDRTADAAGRRTQAPVLALWGAKGAVGQMWDVLATWRSKAANQVTGRALLCGHLLPEEAPEQVLAEFRAFFER
jgi:pimeloyl-ACP methyl ester carboxylesterase